VNAITFGGTLYQTCNYASPGERTNEREKGLRRRKEIPEHFAFFLSAQKLQIDASLSASGVETFQHESESL
jgi:hypothetical protein